ncbi:MAG TPA: bifunctional shikimate kinase/3-dehydroquinate synthase [Gaiellaceae bacterium]|nr:bifunctional shikimate kinase/3-dehydroquinate synthase [Gaiellaceae bacterium]
MARISGANQLKNVALVGFMGSGKSTAARAVGGIDVDDLVETRAGKSIPEIFREEGEAAFRAQEEEAVILALGGGAVTSPRVRDALEDTLTIWLDVDVDTCWERVRASDRPLAHDEAEFRRLYAERRSLYAEVADVVARDVDDVALAAAGVVVERGALRRLGELVPGDGAVALISDPHVAGIHGMDAQLALGARLAETHELPPGEQAKTLAAVDRVWQELRLDRSGTIVALGGGCTTDAAGFAAATYLRGIAWTAVPTSLVAQVDAAIGGKTAIDLPEGKNLVGAFHWPARTVVDPALLETLPEPQRLEGMAEVVKTGLLTGEALWELPDEDLVRRCAAFKAAVCLRDPHERGERAILNLGHTFAHGLEAAAGYEGLTHGRAVALGLLAALRLSGRDTDVVEELLRPQPARVDRERAWEAMQRDKKARGGELRLVLLDDDGPRTDVAVPEEDVRRELDRLIA